MSTHYTADAHCDFLYYAMTDGFDIAQPNKRQAIALPYLKAGNVALQFFAAWVDTGLRIQPLQQCLDMIDIYHTMIDDNEALVRFSPEFVPDGVHTAAVLTIEGGEAIAGRRENLRLFHRLGVRAMTLTWNEANELASPAMRRLNKGLTALGKSVVDEMCRIGMAVDVAHLSDAGIDNVLERATRPIFASHSNARAICGSRRCLSDAHIKAIAECGGVICVNFYPEQLSQKRADANIGVIAEHIEHIAAIGGIRAAGIGSDFDGMSVYPPDIRNSSDITKLIKRLEDNGWKSDDIDKVSYHNLRDFIAQFCS